MIARLEERLAELAARQKQDSTNSSRPPSRGSKFKRPPPRAPMGHRPGGQPGQKGHRCAALEPTQRIPVVPCTCEQRGADLPAGAFVGAPLRHQVVDFLAQLVVTEYELWRVRRARCKKATPAGRPARVPGRNLTS